MHAPLELYGNGAFYVKDFVHCKSTFSTGTPHPLSAHVREIASSVDGYSAHLPALEVREEIRMQYALTHIVFGRQPTTLIKVGLRRVDQNLISN